MLIEEIESKLNILRKRWKDEPHNREIIAVQGRALRIALDNMLKNPPPIKKNSTYEDAKEVFT